jgi:hypothetical protein
MARTTITSPYGLDAYGVRMIHESRQLTLVPTSTPGSTGKSTPEENSTLSTVELALIVVSGVLLLIIIGCLVAWWVTRRAKRQRNSAFTGRNSLSTQGDSGPGVTPKPELHWTPALTPADPATERGPTQTNWREAREGLVVAPPQPEQHGIPVPAVDELVPGREPVKSDRRVAQPVPAAPSLPEPRRTPVPAPAEFAPGREPVEVDGREIRAGRSG